MRELENVPDGVPLENKHVAQLIQSWTGAEGDGSDAQLAGIPLRQTAVNEDDLYAIEARNRGVDGLHLKIIHSSGSPTLVDVTDTGATLTGATLTGATLTDATLSDATLTDATLTDATLTDAILTEPFLKGAKLNVGADIPSAATITIPDDVDVALVTGTTAISTINGGASGRLVRLYFAAADCQVSGADIIVDDTMYFSQVNSSLTLVYVGTKWREWSRTGVRAGLSVWLWQDGDQTIANSTFTTVGQPGAPWTVIANTGGLWNPANPQAIIDSCPVSGLYIIGGVMKWDGLSNLGRRTVATYIVNTNKTDNIDGCAPSPVADTHQDFWTVKYFEAGDQIELRVDQSSGADLDIIGASTTDIVCFAALFQACARIPDPG